MALLWLLILLTLLPLWNTDEWWVRLWDFPRLQIACLLLVGLVGVLITGTRRGLKFWTTIAAGLAAFTWQATHFFAYLPLAPKQVAATDDCPANASLSLLNVNVQQANRRYGELLQIVERIDPDLLLLLETDDRWAEAVTPLNEVYAYRLGEALPNTYGLLLFSKLPMEARVRHRLQADIPSIEARLQLANGASINFHGVHPEPPLPGDDSGERDAELVLVGRDVRAGGRAAVVMGDLNDVAWSDTSRLFRQLSGMADPRAGRGLYPTYHAKVPLARWPLDHLFVTPHFRLMAIDRLGSIGSDHFPIFYRICLSRNDHERLAAPQPEPDVQRQASNELREGQQERAAEGRDD